MKGLGSPGAFCTGILVGCCSMYLVLRQVWFERSYPLLSEAQETAASASEVGGGVTPADDDMTNWKKDGDTLINLLHPHHTGDSNVFVNFTISLKGLNSPNTVFD